MKVNAPFPPQPDVQNMQRGMTWPRLPELPRTETVPGVITQEFMAQQLYKNGQVQDLINLLSGTDREGTMQIFDMLRKWQDYDFQKSRRKDQFEGPDRSRPWAK